MELREICKASLDTGSMQQGIYQSSIVVSTSIMTGLHINEAQPFQSQG